MRTYAGARQAQRYEWTVTPDRTLPPLKVIKMTDAHECLC
jgi:hypothetical protein